MYFLCIKLSYIDKNIVFILDQKIISQSPIYKNITIVDDIFYKEIYKIFLKFHNKLDITFERYLNGN